MDDVIHLAVRALRRKKGMSQKTLATSIGVSQGNLSEMERGLRVWTEPKIRAAALALGVNPGELFIVHDDSLSGSAAAA